MRAVFILLGSIVMLAGCQSESQKKQDVARHSESYQVVGDYESLNWLAENFLKQGMSLSQVESVLGKSDGVFGEETPKDGGSYSRKYTSKREAPYGHLLIAHFSQDKLTGWEWASE